MQLKPRWMSKIQTINCNIFYVFIAKRNENSQRLNIVLYMWEKNYWVKNASQIWCFTCQRVRQKLDEPEFINFIRKGSWYSYTFFHINLIIHQNFSLLSSSMNSKWFFEGCKRANVKIRYMGGVARVTLFFNFIKWNR